MWKIRIIALLFVALGIGLGGYLYQSQEKGNNPFKLGLDLSGGSYLVYKADISTVAEEEISDSMDALRDTIERRINAFGIAEPNVNTETHTLGVEGTEHRLVIELPGVTDLDEAVELIGQTPLLEFKSEASAAVIAEIQNELAGLSTQNEDGETANVELSLEQFQDIQDRRYVSTALTGKYLEKSQLQFSQAGIQNGGGLQSRPIISLRFNSEGAKLFEELTRDNVGKTIAIYLDGILVSAPTVNTAISGGEAIIEGGFTLEEAKETVGRLNSGALPIPIELISTNTIGPTLGHDAVEAGVYAGILGLILIGCVLIVWYRLPGLIAVVALGIYTAVMLWMFKFIPITLTSAGITGFIISIGIAVDANILIFERMKEEIKAGKNLYASVETGFKRAWASIRDANISSVISAVVLFWQGTALIKGFALTFGLGILISMITAVTITRFLLLSLAKKGEKGSRIMRFLYQNGLTK
jgi:protein-export membrane protein SecD